MEKKQKKDKTPVWADALSKLLAELKSKDAEQRATAAQKLKNYVAAQARELSSESFSKFMTDLTNNHICDLINSPSSADKVAAVLAIDCLIDIEHDENEKTTKFSNYLRLGLQSNEPAVITPASKALGRLAQASGTVTAVVVEFELKRALEWLQEDKHELRRYTAVLVLKELAENAPTLFYVHVASFFDLVWAALRDNSDKIREGAVEALHAALALISMRENRLRLQWYHKIFEEAQKGLKLASSASIHGSLLTLGELIDNSGEFMHTRFKEVCETVLRYRDYRDKLVKKTVIQLLPRLAAFSPDDFVHNYLNTCMTFLFLILKGKPEERAVAFIAVGNIARAVGPNIKPYLDSIVSNLKAALVPKSKSFCMEAITCVSMLSSAVGPTIQPHIHDLLDLMFAVGLNQTLTEALAAIAENIPSMLPNIQEKLMDHVSIILSGQPFVHPGSVHKKIARVSSGVMSPPVIQQIQLYNDKDKSPAIQLALKTLGTFNLQENLLTEFLREVVVGFLDDDDPSIRKAASMSCSALLVRSNRNAPTRGHLAVVIGEILEKLLIVGIADPDPSIRKAVLSCLDTRFDHHLAQAENLRSLFIALNDEVFEIRELAITTIGRLTIRNPAYVMPSLRKTLIQLLTELEFSGDSRNKEESARLLGHLIASSQQLIKPYVEPILNALLPKLKDPNPRVASCVLATLGELATVGGPDMNPYIHQLLPLIIDTLQDKSSVVKREVALRTLGLLAEGTGYVIEPFLRYPKLLEIVLNEVKTEQAPSIRKEVVKVLGILGALDPYKQKTNEIRMHKNMPSDSDSNSNSNVSLDTLSGMAPSSEDYYLTISIHCLIRILRDPSRSSYHTTVIQSVMFIFKSLGLKCIPFLPQIMPPFLQVMRTNTETDFLKFLFKQLGQLVAIVKQHVRDFLDEIFVLIKEYWHSPLLDQIVGLVEEISMALNDEFKVYLPELIPQMLSVLHTDRTKEKSPTRNVLHALEVFGTNLDDYLHLIIPAVVKLFEQVDAPVNVRIIAIQTLGRLCNKLNFSDYSSRIIHPLARALEISDAELRKEVMETLCILVYQLGSDYAIFIPMVNKVLVKHRIEHATYETLVSRLLKNQPLLLNETEFVEMRRLTDATKPAPSDPSFSVGGGLRMNEQKLKKAFEASHSSTKDDWENWIRRVSVELLTQSPSPALRACLSVAQMETTLARDLFNSSFVSCWTEMHDQYQDQIIHSLETALNSSSIPPEILQALLNLAEFMEHDDKPLPINIKTLGGLAEKCAAYAKALHYKEIEFQSSAATTCEALISINNQLDLPEAAVGILLYARRNHDIELKESWYEKLQRWDQAMEVYEQKQKEQPGNTEVSMGRMRCLHALAEWEELSKLCEDTWARADKVIKKKMAPLAAAAAWNLGKWSALEEYISAIPDHTVDGSFFRAILNLHADNFEEAQLNIGRTRELLDTELRALVGESYNRAYKVVVKVQQLSEMEEVIAYKRAAENPDRRSIIRAIWNKRLKGCQRNVEVWQDMLAVRSMVIPAPEDRDNWLKFASLCRKSGKMRLSQKTLQNLLNAKDPYTSREKGLSEHHPRVLVAYLKHLWDSGDHKLAFERLRELSGHIKDDDLLLARCHLALGTWQEELNDGLSEAIIPHILGSYKAATEYDDNWYKAWHSWALANFEVISYYQKQNKPKKIETHLVPAVHGFFRSIALAPKTQSLQDTLRLLTLWFKYGEKKEVEEALVEGFNTVSIDTWLQVIPQLIARIHSPVPSVARLIHDLLTNLGKEHPQALVYPLSVASKSQSATRQAAANVILDKMRKHSESLVEAALLVSKELIRVAILWHEMWHEGLEEASRLYFGNKDVAGMFKKLEPLHTMLAKGPETLREVSFQQAYGRDLQEALEWCKKYGKSGKTSDLNQAWDLYYHVFRRINKQLPQMTTLELQYVSPKLLDARDLELAVPGTYDADTEEVVKIRSFALSLTVITSKQRPRKLSMFGSDGKEYTFLLKGHEDLRQDERVMQLFGLINTMLSNDRETAGRHLSIQRYAIIPLSPNSGLIGWVPNHDTLHALIRDYRESRKILLNVEHRLMLQMAANYDDLTLIQKVEVFEYALENTPGTDLDKVLWLKSPNSEVWLDRRTNYTRSLAVMSMVGYILGLGDRHPSNLMLDRITGRITHIDFGDCFEVAMQRDKYPEKIPFRLTRMLINAMEVSGIEGNFRSTCENVMRVLRENKESVMAVLEAFVYDPLINWRLLQPNSPDATSSNSSATKQSGNRDRSSSNADSSDETPDILDSPQGEDMYGSGKGRARTHSTRRHTGDGSDMGDVTPSSTYHQSLISRVALAELNMAGGAAGGLVNEKALKVIERVSAKLRGKDFSPKETLTVPEQVQRLIDQATSHENLCQCYIGWCPFW